MATVIQLFNDEDLSLAIGYLDVSDNIPLPITYSVSDVKNVGERTASSSKSIILPGTKNNNQLFGQLFDVNIEFGLATYNIYKKQKCAVITDTRLVMDNAFLQLVSVTKRKNTQTQEDEIEYEVLVKSQIFNFFTQIQNRNLEDLDFSEFDHDFTGQDINDSMPNTWEDGYNYVLPYNDTTVYFLKNLKPSIYAKQYWDKIHEQAGYTYDWSSLTDNFVRFDKMIVTANNEDNRINDYINDGYQVKANNTVITNEIIAIGDNINLTYFKKLLFNIDYDPSSSFDLANDRWTNPFTNPDSLTFTLNLPYGESLAVGVSSPAAISQGASSFRTILEVYDVTNSVTISSTVLAEYSWEDDDEIVPAGSQIFLRDPNIKPLQVVIELNNLNVNVELEFYFRFEIDVNTQGGVSIEYRNYIKSTPSDVENDFLPQLNIQYTSNNVPFGFKFPMNAVIPTKFTQRNFIDGIIKMFNLYVEPDKLNQRNLIYKLRDDFYDEGKVLNWSNKLMVNMDQKVEFLSDLNFKNLVLTYKSDSDDANKTYTDATKEIFGQITTTFDTEWLKNTETITNTFSPTPIGLSAHRGLNPYIDYTKNFNSRILMDSGFLIVNPFAIVNYISVAPTPGVNITPISVYKAFTTFDNPFNPNYEINYGQPDYYFYNTNKTDNNLYNLNWKRTYQQLNSSRLLTAYFDLNEVDIATLSLADKIWCMNKYWLINAIVDYDANANKPTEVELISYEEAGITLPILG
jgi:hypothetical protein